ncbi:DNA-binding transcriptional regulator, LysR family [Variovorax sp. CF079]|uniref:LysR substrate-binding domain-containing protein n=1 Tax=Variovorax sp. CF079 TaxID=1882774 RepID=UPI0008845D01|nr:LysR substrate-binding domain-containing protein [Variovorax sp. CF079]SDE70329.1 DNA-binding transcriptional regulator, LysR family [Variovorax sp. CF079]
MDSTALATFLAVARQGSVTGASLELHTVQSNVTLRMKQLEADFDVPLFVRHSRGVTLTPAGARLLIYAERLQALAAEARAAVSDTGVVKGSLRIGSMETTAAVRLPGLLAGFYKAYPEVQIEVRTGPTAELLEHVLAHRLDGALVAGPINHPDLVTRRAFREELVLVTALGTDTMSERLAQGGLTVITFRQGCSYRQRLDAEFINRGWVPYRRLEMGTVEGILGCVGGNVGVTVLPRSVVETSQARGALRIEPFVPEPLFVETLFVRRSAIPAGTTMSAFEQRLGATELVTAATI